ncbi:hypothetical protein VP01_722g5 [Puccinia sorghi]|uniref:Uncharacterized protein n=1 Tax=Puccinia sorghi TaxID=27349 RepID=A0A0L6UD37_9BASI|nr:hypothetical protein VP01_722g5 [Puccinia sorghi]
MGGTSLWNSLVSISFSHHLKMDQFTGYISDIQHRQNFKNCLWNENLNTLKLGMFFFVNWFTPRGNKLSGSHLCLAGITPESFSAKPNTINHPLCPLVNELINMENGILIPKNEFPVNQVVQVKVLALFGDVLETKNVSGITSHLETRLCSFCHAICTKIPQLQLSKQCKKIVFSKKLVSVGIKLTGLLGSKLSCGVRDHAQLAQRYPTSPSFS